MPDAPAFLALVDLTGSVAYIDAVKASLRCLVKSLPEYCLFGLMTFDETLGVYRSFLLGLLLLGHKQTPSVFSFFLPPTPCSLSARSPQVRVTPLPRAATRHPKGILDLFSLPQILCQVHCVLFPLMYASHDGEEGITCSDRSIFLKLIQLEGERTTALAAIDLLTATGGADARPAADYSLPASAASQRPSQPSVVGRGLGPALQMLLASLGEMYKLVGSGMHGL